MDSVKIKTIVTQGNDGFWVDQNGNKWNIESFTSDQAMKCSESLAGSHGCLDWSRPFPLLDTN